MRASMEAHGDFVLPDGDIGGHVDQVTEDLAGLSIAVTAHARRHDAIQATGQNQKGHIEIHFKYKADRRRESIDVEEPHRIGEGIFDEHAFGVP